MRSLKQSPAHRKLSTDISHFAVGCATVVDRRTIVPRTDRWIQRLYHRERPDSIAFGAVYERYDQEALYPLSAAVSTTNGPPYLWASTFVPT